MAVPGTFTSGQVLTAAEMNDLPGGIITSVVDSSGSGSLTAAGEDTVLVSGSFTPVAGRKYKISYNIGQMKKTTGNGDIYLTLRLGSTSAGTLLDQYRSSSFTLGQERGRGKFGVFTTAELGTSATTVCMGVYTNNNGADWASAATYQSFLLVEDIGT